MTSRELDAALHLAMRDSTRLSLPDEGIAAADGARIREQVAARFLDAGDRVAGHKIGLGSSEAQAGYAVRSPGRGYLFESQMLPGGSHLDPGQLTLLAEVEVAVVVGHDVAPDSSDDAVLAAIERACVAIEIVGTRWDPSPRGFIGAWMADNGMAHRAVLGERRALQDPHAPLAASLEVDGVRQSGSVAPAILPNLRWLIDDLAESGRRLTAGQVVLTGALLPATTISGGGRVTATVSGYGSVELAVARSVRDMLDLSPGR